MAKLILEIEGKTSEITVDDSKASKVRDRAWEAYHRKGETATDQEKVEWLVNTILKDALSKASARKDKVEEREKRRKEMEERRRAREERRNQSINAPKFE